MNEVRLDKTDWSMFTWQRFDHINIKIKVSADKMRLALPRIYTTKSGASSDCIYRTATWRWVSAFTFHQWTSKACYGKTILCKKPLWWVNHTNYLSAKSNRQYSSSFSRVSVWQKWHLVSLWDCGLSGLRQHSTTSFTRSSSVPGNDVTQCQVVMW